MKAFSLFVLLAFGLALGIGFSERLEPSACTKLKQAAVVIANKVFERGERSVIRLYVDPHKEGEKYY
jgi:hypothetical protein